MDISCNVILDLIPLVKDGVASEESTLLVRQHIDHCEICKAEFEIFNYNKADQPSIKDEKILATIKRSLFITQALILIIGAIVGLALTNTMGMFYNFAIMPLVGGISVFVLKQKWYLMPLAIFIFTYLWQTIMSIVLGGFSWIALYGGLYYSIIYAGLVGLGIVIMMLLKFAFRKEG